MQAQTMANFFLALEANLSVIPIINKIDLPHANVQQTLHEMHSAFGITDEETIKCSAKTGVGIDRILPSIIKRIPR